MKKILLLFVFASVLLSCSSSDEDAQPKVLKKVVFYQNSANERHWNIVNNLLSTITLPNGTVVEEFIYDSQRRVIRDIKYENGIIIENTTITYSTGNIINSINNLPYSYNAAARTYAYSYGSNFTIDCTVNEDMLAVDFVRNGFNPSEYHMSYSNGDMTSFRKVNNGGEDVVKNFYFDAGFGENPIYDAILPVARVKTLTDPEFFVDCQPSINMANGFDKGTSDPNYYNYGLILGSKELQVGVEVLDSSNNFVEFYQFANYNYN